MRNLVYVTFAAALAGCGSNGSTGTDAGGGSNVDAPSPDASNLVPVNFTYTPSWGGVVSVAVIGGFGQSGDWTTPLVALTMGTDGSFTGTAMVPPGTYPYLFQIVGDADAGAGSATFPRYSLDGTVSEIEACPAGPTIANEPTNPCSLVTVPQGAAETAYTLGGSVSVGATPAPKYLIVLERMEATTHHYFVNRSTTGSDGTYSFTVAGGGNYRIMVLNPLYESKKDSQIDPDTTKTVRRVIGTAVDLTADIALSVADVTAPDYTTFQPRNTTTFATPFTFPTGLSAKLDIYGPGTEIGDPWYAATTATTTGTATFDGTFNTQQKMQDVVLATDTYSWGIEVTNAVTGTGPGAVKWTMQSLVYPIAWPTSTL